MTGKIVSVKRFAVHDGEGVRSTVFFKGCPLSCIWCHNPEGISYQTEPAFRAEKCVGCGACIKSCPQRALAFGKEGRPHLLSDACLLCGNCAAACMFGARELYGREVEAEILAEELAEDKPFFEESGGGVTLSGGECLMQPDFALALAKALVGRGISVAVDTCGYAPFSVLEAIIPYTDVFLFDIKAVDADLHQRLTGRDNRLILDNFHRLCAQNCKMEVRIPFVKGCNDGEMAAIAHLLAGKGNIKKVTLLPYHDMARSKYAAVGRPDTMPQNITTHADVAAAAELLRSYQIPAVPAWED